MQKVSNFLSFGALDHIFIGQIVQVIAGVLIQGPLEESFLDQKHDELLSFQGEGLSLPSILIRVRIVDDKDNFGLFILRSVIQNIA